MLVKREKTTKVSRERYFYFLGSERYCSEERYSTSWAGESANQAGQCGGLPWRPQDFGDFLRRSRQAAQYNEIIVDSKAWRADGPLVVEAIFGNKEIHRGFIDKFPHLAASHPFMVFDPMNWHSPLSLAH